MQISAIIACRRSIICVQDMLRPCVQLVIAASSDTDLAHQFLDIIVLAQDNLISTGSFDIEAALFQALAPFFFVEIAVSRFSSDSFRELFMHDYENEEKYVLKNIFKLLPSAIFGQTHSVVVAIRDNEINSWAFKNLKPKNFDHISNLKLWTNNNDKSQKSSRYYESLSQILHNHAVCLLNSNSKIQTPRLSSGTVTDTFMPYFLLLSAAIIVPNNSHRQLMLGASLEDVGDTLNSGFWISSLSVFNMHHSQISLLPYVDIRYLKHQKRIAFYCNEFGNTWWPKWGPSSLENGAIGGSEEAVIMIAEELAKLNYDVTVYADPNPEEIGTRVRGVLWMHYLSYDISNPPDVLVAWRYSISIGGLCPAASFTSEIASPIIFNYSIKCVLWLHDIVPATILPKTMLNILGGNTITVGICDC